MRGTVEQEVGSKCQECPLRSWVPPKLLNGVGTKHPTMKAQCLSHQTSSEFWRELLLLVFGITKLFLLSAVSMKQGMV